MLPSEILKTVKLIEIKTRHLVNNIFGGEYHSAFKGKGMEFAEVREYVPGDDVRDIDWNVTARAGKPFIKKYNEERELTVILMIDLSASSFFGSGTHLKSDLMVELSSVLSFSAIKNNDKVGLLLFSNEIEKYIPPQKGKFHVFRIIRELINYKSIDKKTNIAEAVDFITNVTKRKSVIFLLSDFMDKDYLKQLCFLSKKHDLIAIKFQDKLENVISSLGLIKLHDSETKKSLWVDTSFKIINSEMHSLNSNNQSKLNTIFKKNKIDLISINTNNGYIEPLVRFFNKRSR